MTQNNNLDIKFSTPLQTTNALKTKMDQNIKKGKALSSLEGIKKHYTMIIKVDDAEHLKNTIREAIGKAYELGLTSKIKSLQEENKFLKEQLGYE